MMQEKYTTENETVDAVGKIRFRGNVIPMIWYSTITKENGKPNITAITVLADIVYWYRPTEIRDENSGQLIGYKKKFQADVLQRGYDAFAELFGFSKRQVKDAIVSLEKMGLIKREFRHLRFKDFVVSNVMYIHLNAERLFEVTYPENKENETKNKGDFSEKKTDKAEEVVTKNREVSDENPSICVTKKDVSMCRKNVRPCDENPSICVTKKDVSMCRKNVRPCDENPSICVTKKDVSMCRKNVRPCDENPTHGYTKNRQTNTYITTENTTETNPSITTKNTTETNPSITTKNTTEIRESISINQSREGDELNDGLKNQKRKNLKEVEAEVKEQVNYDSIYSSCSEKEQCLLNKIVSIVVDVSCENREYFYAGKRIMETKDVQEKFASLTEQHIRYVLDSIKNSAPIIKNIKAYLIISLYNAPDTIELNTNSESSERKESIVNRVKSKFSNFHEREYDFSTLEKALIYMG